jgi:DNA primase
VIVRPPSTEQRLLLEQAVSQYQRDLAGDTAAQAYLMSRGFGPEVASTFRLGVVRTPLVGHEGYRGRLAIPYNTPAGPVNLRFRCLKQHSCKDEGCPKYLSSEGADSNLFNVLDLRKPSDFICVAEGELDTITLSMCGLPAVGVPGASNWGKHFSRCLDDFSAVFVFGDPDDAGKGLNKKLINDVRARPVRMPKGLDCNDVYRRDGAEGLHKLIAG